VAIEQRWDARTFIERTCLKAGLRPDAWTDPAATVELFSTEELG
jgi:AMMECR1 domain-containing protein